MFWSIIEANKRKTVLLIVLMGLFLILTGSVIGMAFLGGDYSSAGLTGALIAAAVWVVMLLMSLYTSDTILLEASRAREVSRETYPQLFNVVEEMVIAGSLTAMPKIHVVADPAPNAFAMGISPEKSHLCVTAGLLAACTRDELQGVVAHEIGHIMNRDVLYMTVAASMLGSILLLSDYFLRSMRYSTIRFASKSKKAGAAGAVLLLLSLLLAVLGPVLARVLYFSISRKREFLADATSARLTRYPEGLASALEKIGKYPNSLSAAPAVTAPFYIVNPGRQSLSDSAFSTHPPLTDRIRILRAMSQGAGYLDYLKAYIEVTRKHKALIPQGDLKDAGHVEIRAPQEEPSAQTQADEVKRRAGEIIRAMNDFIFITCPCGLKLKLPPEYAGKEVSCPRCRRTHVVKKPDAKTFGSILSSSAALGSPRQASEQTVQLEPGTWQSISCDACGHPYELSPCFSGSKLTCSSCGSIIRFTPGASETAQA